MDTVSSVDERLEAKFKMKKTWEQDPGWQCLTRLIADAKDPCIAQRLMWERNELVEKLFLFQPSLPGMET